MTESSHENYLTDSCYIPYSVQPFLCFDVSHGMEINIE